MIVVILITAAITGSFASLGAGGNAITQLMPAMGGGLLVGWLIGWAGSIVVQMAIIGGLYQAGFGKGALIWLLAIVFSFLLSAVFFLIVMIFSASTLQNWLNQAQNLFQGGYQYFVPLLKTVI